MKSLRVAALPLFFLAMATACSAAPDGDEAGEPSAATAEALTILHLPGPFLTGPGIPTSLVATTSTAYCAAHAPWGGLACEAAAHGGSLIIGWEWAPTVAPRVDGFRVYRVDHGAPVKIGETRNGATTRLFVVPLPADGYLGKCYAVSSFVGADESFMSPRLCVTAATPIGSRWTRVAPASLRSYDHERTGDTGIAGPTNDFWVGSIPDLRVGWSNEAHINWYGDTFWNHDYFAAAWFDVADVAELRGRMPLSARLTVTILTDDLTSNVPPRHSCATQIGNAIDPWWTGSRLDAPRVDAWSDLPAGDNEIAVDVSGTVQSWLANQTAIDGFVLRAPDTQQAFRNDWCISHLSREMYLDIETVER
jgi:hypothetical protein